MLPGTTVAPDADGLSQGAGCASCCGGAQGAQTQAQGGACGLTNRFRVLLTSCLTLRRRLGGRLETLSAGSGYATKRLWAKIPEAYRQHATFYTDQYVVYEGVIPAAQHRAISKLARKTDHIERFNNTLRQRVSRLVREALSFSKKLANHIGAIKLFICHYNLTKASALHG